MRIQGRFVNMLSVMWLVSLICLSVPGGFIYADDKVQESQVNNPDGSRTLREVYSSGATSTATIAKDNSYTVTETDKHGNVISSTTGTKYGQVGGTSTKTDQEWQCDSVHSVYNAGRIRGKQRHYQGQEWKSN
jgi:hypothetical protein